MKKLFIALSFVFFFYALFIGFLGYSSFGTRLIQKTVNTLSSGLVFVERAEGRLLAGWSLEGIEIQTPGVDISLASLEGDWQPAMLFLGKLQVESFKALHLVIHLKDEGTEAPQNSAQQESFSPPAFLLPIAVNFRKILLEDVSIVTTSGAKQTIVDKMETRFDGWGGLLSFSDFLLKGPDYDLAFHGSVDVLHEYNLDLGGQLSFKGFGFQQLHGTFSFAGPLDNPQIHLGVSHPGDITIDGKVDNLLGAVEWSAILNARDVDLSTLFESCPEIDLQTVYADISGDTSGYRGRVEALGDYDNLLNLELVSDLDADDWMSIDFKSFRIDKDDASAVAENAKISWYSIFEWDGEFAFKNIDPSIFSDALQGTLSADLISKGDVKEVGVVASFLVSNIEGVLHDQAVNGQGNIFLDEYRVYTDGFTIHSGEFEGIALIQQASFSWEAEPSWSGDVRVSNFNPAWFYPDFQGQVNGHFLGDGLFSEEGPEVHLQLSEVSGSLFGNDLSGGGEVWLSDSTLRTTGLFLNNGPSSLSIRGRAGDALAIDFSFISPNIGLIVPESTGELNIEGSLSGGRIEPELDFVVQGSGLSYREDSLSTVKADLHTVIKKDGTLNAVVKVDNINISGLHVDQSDVNVTGTLAKHHMSLNIVNGAHKLSVQANGGYDEGWTGWLVDLNMDSQVFGTWTQSGEANAQFSNTAIEISSFCLVEDTRKGSGQACLNGKLLFDDLMPWSLDMSLQSIPLKSLDVKNIITVPLAGTVNGTLLAKGDKLQVSGAKANVTVVDAYVDLENYFEERDRIQFNETTLNVELAAKHLQGVFNCRMDNGSALQLRADVTGIGVFTAPLDQMMLGGLLELDDFDLVLLDSLTSYSVEPSGKLFSTIKLSGSAAEPKVSGNIYLKEGGIDLPLQGITLTDLSVDIEAEEDGAVVKGKAHSGSGQLDVEGQLQYKDFALKGDLRLRGTDFELFNIPEYVIHISPDVQLHLSEDEARLEGEVEIPYGVITPEAMRGTISVSEDVVFINGDDEVKDEGWPIFSSMKVSLGEDVTIDGYGLKGKLIGKIDVEMVPNEMLTGKGELALAGGTFDIYGRLLNIVRGRVLFTGGPIDNPGIDVRAQKEVSDSQARGDGYTVGVDISGLVQDLKFNLFSDPYMEDADILSQMIVGGSFGNSSESDNNLVSSAAEVLGIKGGSSLIEGLGTVLSVDDLHIEGTGREEDVSLVVGKKLGNRLYIGYDVNMFSQLGQFRVRYDLTNGFAVETTSSTESTGADFLYSFEK